MGIQVCVFCNSNSFHSFIFKFCIMIVHTLKMYTSYLREVGSSKPPLDLPLPLLVAGFLITLFILFPVVVLMSKKPPDEHVEGRLPIQSSTVHNRFNPCQAGRPSLDVEEKQCFISTV